ncbi:flavodoxin family protein [Curtobacterium sp. 22159]|uniref:flavodoxin family protein n=1 Tax=Curtobacterium sp. 22159 TaxID=3453882 RepID=UPI003F83FE92
MERTPTPPARYDDLRALYVNCTLKRSPEPSHTQGLMDRSIAIMRDQGVTVDSVRLIDHDVATGVYPDMRQHGWAADEWPDTIWPLVRDADVLVVGGPLWLGENASVTRTFIERLYAMSGLLNTSGQYVFYGKTAGTLITGNEDGVKHAAMSTLYSLQHIGYVIPPAADAGWIGEVGPGPSYLDPGSGGPENDFTNRNTTFMTWNLLHMARLLRDAGGYPAHGNQRALWDGGERFGADRAHPNPEYR